MKESDRLRHLIGSSAVFLVVGTIDYLQDLKDGRPGLAQQIAVARVLRKKVLLCISKRLLQAEADELRAFFSGFEHVIEIALDTSDLSATRKAIKAAIATLRGTQPGGGESEPLA